MRMGQMGMGGKSFFFFVVLLISMHIRVLLYKIHVFFEQLYFIRSLFRNCRSNFLPFQRQEAVI